MYANHLPAYVYIDHMGGWCQWKSREGRLWIAGIWSHGWLWAAAPMLGMEPGSSARATLALTCWVISPAPHPFFLCVCVCIVWYLHSIPPHNSVQARLLKTMIRFSTDTQRPFFHSPHLLADPSSHPPFLNGGSGILTTVKPKLRSSKIPTSFLPVLGSFISTGHKLQSSERREPRLKKMLP